MAVKVQIELTTDLPIARECGAVKGRVFDAEYKYTETTDDGVEYPAKVRDRPVEFTGDNGDLCVAFSYEYKRAQ